MHVTETQTHRARKRHRCQWCWQFIETGELYRRYRVFDGDASTVRMHPECYDAMQDDAADAGGFIEWTPGQERPAIDASIAATRKEEQ
jgi:hypothetical protein